MHLLEMQSNTRSLVFWEIDQSYQKISANGVGKTRLFFLRLVSFCISSKCMLILENVDICTEKQDNYTLWGEYIA